MNADILPRDFFTPAIIVQENPYSKKSLSEYIPEDLLLSIFSFSDFKSIAALTSVCRKFSHLREDCKFPEAFKLTRSKMLDRLFLSESSDPTQEMELKLRREVWAKESAWVKQIPQNGIFYLEDGCIKISGDHFEVAFEIDNETLHPGHRAFLAEIDDYSQNLLKVIQLPPNKFITVTSEGCIFLWKATTEFRVCCENIVQVHQGFFNFNFGTSRHRIQDVCQVENSLLISGVTASLTKYSRIYDLSSLALKMNLPACNVAINSQRHFLWDCEGIRAPRTIINDKVAEEWTLDFTGHRIKDLKVNEQCLIVNVFGKLPGSSKLTDNVYLFDATSPRLIFILDAGFDFKKLQLHKDVLLHINKNLIDAWHSETGRHVCNLEMTEDMEITHAEFVDANTLCLHYKQKSTPEHTVISEGRFILKVEVPPELPVGMEEES
jgi:hypothetical protein